jgi:DNA-directed RNA polymerase subunit H (RpoH/RPB5)
MEFVNEANQSSTIKIDDVKISLCIPTKDRFDEFLEINLTNYLGYLNDGIIDEIVVCDENGNDYNKIVEKFGYAIETTQKDKFRVYKNDEILGVFLNKLKVCNLAKNNYIALIDSDNFASASYFNVAKDYIVAKQIISKRALCPSFARPRFDVVKHEYNHFIINKHNCKDHIHFVPFHILINTGNFVLTKDVVENLKYDVELLPKISACDVMYFSLLTFQQFDGMEMHVVDNLEYDHVVHSNCVSIETYEECDYTKYYKVIPQFFDL